MIVLNITGTTIEIDCTMGFFSKVAFRNPGISNWLTLQGETLTTDIANLDRLVSLVHEAGLTVEYRENNQIK